MKQKQNLLKKEENRGITLVALVVTIVVLLILAGITITMLFSDSGIITKAREAAEATKKAQSDTEKGLNDLAEELGVSLGEAPTIKNKGEIVDKNIKTKYAKWTDDTSSDIVPVPGGYCVVKDSEGEGEDKQNTVKSGLVISDLEGDTLDNAEITVNGEQKKGNQFVWVPVPDASTIYEVQNGKNVGKLYDFSSTGSNAKAYSSTSYREPDILSDKYYGDASTGTKETTYNGIKNLKEVVGITADEGIEDEQQQNKNILEKWKNQLQSEFDSMIESVKRYGGFYIGRYETQGMSSEISDGRKIEDIKPTVQKGKTPSTSINWYYMYQESKNIRKENNNVTSSMIWGCQWDRTLDWIAQTNLNEEGQPNYELLTDSSSWGNYNNGSSPKTSGFDSNWQKNHIYDLAGNVHEWTLEAYDTNARVFRGGNDDVSGSDNSASYRFSYGFPTGSGSRFGSRSTIYINLENVLSTETEENTSNYVPEPVAPTVNGAVNDTGDEVIIEME